MGRADGMNYAPQGKPNPVVEKGEFRFAASWPGSRAYLRDVEWIDRSGRRSGLGL